MTADDAAFLAALPGWAFAFVLVLTRISGAVMVMPGLGEAELPAPVKIGLSLALTALLLPGLAPLVPPVPGAPWRLAAMVGAELLTGLWLGWLARLLVSALPVAGQIISYMTGLSSVLVPDPTLGGSGTGIERLFGLASTVLILGTGLYALPLSGLAGSYRLVPPGALLPSGDVTEMVVRGVSESFALAVRLAAPFVLAAVVWQVALGLMTRLVPSLHVYFVAMPAQIIGGLALLALLGAALLGAWSEAVRAGYGQMAGLH